MSFYKLCRRLYRKGQDERGFTMVEMMVVLIIIAVLIGLGVFFYVKHIDRAKVTRAKGELNAMAASLDAYFAEKGEYPANETDAISKAGLPEDPNNKGSLPKDPWGVKYVYTTNGTNEYTLEAKDSGNNVRVQATGKDGVSQVEAK